MTPTGNGADVPAPLVVRAVPWVIFAVLAAVTFLVWQQQVASQRTLTRRHTTDVCFQAARRVQVLVESQLQLAAFFGRRWATHGERDSSRQRFDELAALLAEQLPGYHAARLIHAQSAPDWVAPPGVRSTWPAAHGVQRALLAAATKQQRIVVSAPIKTHAGRTVLFAAVPLSREGALMGHLVVEIRAHELIGSGFHDRIRSEFFLSVNDGTTPLFCFAGTRSCADRPAANSVTKAFPIHDRTWRMIVAPRSSTTGSRGWNIGIASLLLGISLSVGISLLVHLLARRARLFRGARDRALAEMAAREETQDQLRRSEQRYRNVFDSATDGMLILDDDGVIVDANPAAAAMHGYPLPDFINRSVTELIAPAQQHLYDEFRRQIVRSGAARLDSVHLRSDGRTFDVEVRGTTFDYAGQSRTLDILTDVSARKQAQRSQALLSRKVLMAQEEERARVSRDLHDELGQILTALHLELSWLHKKTATEAGRTVDGFASAIAMVQKAANELRRICKGLRPPLLDDLGLEPAARLLIEEFEEHSAIKYDLEVRRDECHPPITREVGLCAYRILQEALHNASRHANAKEVNISLVVSQGGLLLSVYDDGQGFDVQGVGPVGGYGIAGMRERASLVGGNVDIRSEPAQGTRVVLSVPLGTRGQEKEP